MKRGREERLQIQPQHAEHGFTLLELLVSMTVVSLLATTVLFSWRIAAGAWGRASQLVENQRRVAAAHQVLEGQIAEMVSYAPWRRQGIADVFFQGEGQTARFLSHYSLTHRARSGLYRIEYQIAEAGDGTRQLLMNEVPAPNPEESGLLLVGTEQNPQGLLRHFAPFERKPETRVLLDELSEAHFEYYRPAGPWGPGSWLAEWFGRGNELPRAMAIRLTPKAGNGSLPPVSIVAAIASYAGSLPDASGL